MRVHPLRLDVSDPKAVAEAPARVLADHPGVDLLVNNAGVALGGGFEQVAEADFEWLFSINFWGVVRMTRAFLPTLRARVPDARLVNLSSIFGIIAPPGQTAYVASKFAVRGFSESLRHELKEQPRRRDGGASGRRRHLHRPQRPPAGRRVRRRDGERLKFAESKLTLSPTVAGETIVRAAERRRPRVIVGLDAKIAVAAEHFAPVSYWKLLGRGMNRVKALSLILLGGVRGSSCAVGVWLAAFAGLTARRVEAGAAAPGPLRRYRRQPHPLPGPGIRPGDPDGARPGRPDAQLHLRPGG